MPRPCRARVLVSDAAFGTPEVLWLRQDRRRAAPLRRWRRAHGGYVPALDERVGVIISGGNTTAVDFGAT